MELSGCRLSAEGGGRGADERIGPLETRTDMDASQWRGASRRCDLARHTVDAGSLTEYKYIENVDLCHYLIQISRAFSDRPRGINW